MSAWTKYFVFFLLLFFSARESFAQTPQPPQFLNVQAVLLDEGGNVLRNRQEADIEFAIIDGAGNIFYEESQHVFLVDGAISVLVGSGIDIDSREAKSGIPFEALDPNGTRLLRIKLADQSIPQEELELVSVPYSFYSKFAVELTKPITTAGIADGTIALADFSQELVNYIDNSISGISAQDLADHKTETTAHPASSITVRTSLANSAQTDLQSVLDDIDAVLSIYSNQDNELVEDITTNVNNIATSAANITKNTADITSNTVAIAKEITDRTAADETLTDAIQTNATAITTETTARTAADETLTAATQTNATAITTETTARTAADGTLTGSIAAEAAARAAVKSSLDQHAGNDGIHLTETSISGDNGLNNRWVNESGGDTIGGTLTIADTLFMDTANIVMSEGHTVDGIDIGVALSGIPVGETGDQTYLRINGANKMAAALEMDNNNIKNVISINNVKFSAFALDYCNTRYASLPDCDVQMPEWCIIGGAACSTGVPETPKPIATQPLAYARCVENIIEEGGASIGDDQVVGAYNLEPVKAGGDDQDCHSQPGTEGFLFKFVNIVPADTNYVVHISIQPDAGGIDGGNDSFGYVCSPYDVKKESFRIRCNRQFSMTILVFDDPDGESYF